MVKKFRFIYRFCFALLRKRWKKIALILIGMSLFFGATFFFDQIISKIFIKTTAKIIKPVYSEAIVGKMETFNPLFSKTEAEKEINQLVFTGLVKILPDGSIKPDLAERYETKNDIEFTFYLKKNIHWHDGQKFTADDVVHTIQIGQNPLYQSEIEETFRDVEVIKKDDYTVIFRLREPFSPFLSALTLGIIPKHISLNNYRPIGTGSFKFIEIKKDYCVLESKNLKLKFLYYPNLKTAETAVRLGQVHGLANFGSNSNYFSKWDNFQIKKTNLAYREVMVFFNINEKILREKNVRQALAFSTPKEDISKNSFGKKGKIALNSLPDLKIFQTNSTEKYPYDLEKANLLLNSAGWVLQDGFRYKDGEKLHLSITTIDDLDFEDTAIKLRNSWSKLGIEVSIELISGKELKNQIVPNRTFSILLTSQLLNFDPDQYVLWHTTQIKESNVSGINSPKIDKLLEDGRRTSDPKVRAEKYQEFTRIILDEVPAIFLYYPSYNWLVSKRIENIDITNFRVPKDRFRNSQDWKIKTPLF